MNEERAEQIWLDHALAETRRLIVESEKFIAEQRLLIAEAQKADKERWWFPWVQMLTAIVTSALVGALVARLIH